MCMPSYIFVHIIHQVPSINLPVKKSNAIIPAVTAKVEKRTMDQKIILRFFRLFSISSLCVICSSISFITCGSKVWDIVFLRLLFLGIYSFFNDWGRGARTPPWAPNLLLVDQTTNKSNSSGDNFRKVSNAAPSNCFNILSICWLKAIPIFVYEKNLLSSNFYHKYTYQTVV